jgi:outer membrane biosynthesis protein TonB
MNKHRQKLHLPNIKLKFTTSALVLFLLTSLMISFTHSAQAAGGDASFILSPSSGSYTVGKSFTVNVYETSQASDNVEGVQANLSYNATDLQCTSVSESGTPFAYLGQSTCGSGSIQVGEASASVVSGQQLVATINFTALTASSPSLNITSGSDIQNSSSTSVWNGVDSSASYSLVAPVVTMPTSPTTPTTPTTPTKTTTPTTTPTKKSTPVTTSTTPVTIPATTTTPTTTTTTPVEPATTETPTTTSGSENIPGVASLTIVVTDAHGKPVANAKVVVDNQYREITKSQGKAGFGDLNDGTYTVIVSAAGKKSYSQKVVLSGVNSKTVAAKLSGTFPVKAVILVVVIFAVLGALELGFMRYTAEKRKKANYVTTEGDTVIGSNSSGSAMSGTDFGVQTVVAQPESVAPVVPQTSDGPQVIQPQETTAVAAPSEVVTEVQQPEVIASPVTGPAQEAPVKNTDTHDTPPASDTPVAAPSEVVQTEQPAVVTHEAHTTTEAASDLTTQIPGLEVPQAQDPEAPLADPINHDSPSP